MIKRYHTYVLLSVITLSSCMVGTLKTHDKTIFVSIAPLKYIVEQIADPNTEIQILVPETTSPESYEPTVQQIKQLSTAQAYISIGLIDFEQALASKITDLAPKTAYLDLSAGVDVAEGSCSHEDSHHHHGVDPHIWLSPKIVRGFSIKVAALLSEINPDSADVYTARSAKFIASIDSLDSHIAASLKTSKRKTFAIGHPSLTYFARDYNLHQIAIEVDGKEPSAHTISQIVDSLRSRQVNIVLFQRQTSDAAAQTIAREIRGRAIEFDPLATNWKNNLYKLTDTIQMILND